jgi:hypothetical protein
VSDGEWLTKDLGGSGHDLMRTHSWKTLVRIAGVLVEIQTKPFLNTSLKLCL